MHDDIEITIIGRRIINQLPIRSIYEYEENIEVLITNSKPEKEDNYTNFQRTELGIKLEDISKEKPKLRQIELVGTRPNTSPSNGSKVNK